MNERIRELQKQSSIEQWDYDNGCYRYVLNPEKFALLIVRECIRLCDQVDLVGADDCIDNIKEHFEVE